MKLFKAAPAAPIPDEFRKIEPKARNRELFWVGVLAMFLGSMLVRWIGGEVRVFADLQGSILVVCLLGLGLGCLTSREPVALRDILVPLAYLTLLLGIPLTRAGLAGISDVLGALGDSPTRPIAVGQGPARTVAIVAAGLGGMLIFLVLIWDVFVPLGRLTGRLIDDHPRIVRAYSFYVAGAFVGASTFVMLGALGMPPVAWFVVVAALLIALATLSRHGLRRLVDITIALGLIPLAWYAGREPGAIEVHWSPYHRLVLKAVPRAADDAKGVLDYLVEVDDTGDRALLDLSPARVASEPTRFPPSMAGLGPHDLPFRLHPSPRTALILGSGMGNDAGGALRQGVEEVTVVEIDPAIVDLIRRYHPERPYDSPEVEVVVDDPRSYLAAGTGRFDVIAFGLIDSRATLAGAVARPDRFFPTVEGLRAARSRLANGGIVVLTVEDPRPPVVDRLASTLREVFGADPVCFRVPTSIYGRGGVLFVAGNLSAVFRQFTDDRRLGALVARWKAEDPIQPAPTTWVATDDWPYLDLRAPTIPRLYFLFAGLLALLVARSALRTDVRALAAGWDRDPWHFVCQGAGFLLLGAHNVGRASTVLGTTWPVRAAAVSGILALVLLANRIVAKAPRLPARAIYLGLCAACLMLFFGDTSRFAALPFAARASLVGGLTGLPVLLGGILFIQSFAAADRKDQALGANLVGAVAGGLLQAIAFVTGTRALLWVVIALYGAALMTRPRRKPAPLSVRRPLYPSDTPVPSGLTDLGFATIREAPRSPPDGAIGPS